MATDPLEDLSNLLNRAGEVLAPHGLILRTFAVLPNPDPNGTHMVQLIVDIAEDAFKSDEQKEIDAQFEQLAIQARHEESQARIEAAQNGAVESLRSLMEQDKSKGIGLDMGDDS